MRLISIDALKAGEVLSTNIRTGKGMMLLRHGSVLTASFIGRLKSMGIDSLYIEDKRFDDLEVRPSLLDETKAYLLEELSEVYQSVSKGRGLNINSAKKMGKAVYEEINGTALRPVNLINTITVDFPILLHGLNVAVIVAAMALRAGVKPDVAENYVTGALMHDIALSSMDNDMIVDHAARAYMLMKNSAMVGATAYMPVAMHHERYDGTGLPSGIQGDAINLGARMIAVADLYDNLVFGYGGYDKLPLHQAVEYLTMESGRALDPEQVNLFHECVEVYPVGVTVLLNNGQDAIVIDQNEGTPNRPVVRLIRPHKEECLEFNLLHEQTLFIETVYL